jgi:hypothetical protein
VGAVFEISILELGDAQLAEMLTAYIDKDMVPALP